MHPAPQASIALATDTSDVADGAVVEQRGWCMAAPHIFQPEVEGRQEAHCLSFDLLTLSLV